MKQCPHCKMDIEIRNPSGFCDHLHYPEACEICQKIRVMGEDSVIERSETAVTSGQGAPVADPAALRGLQSEATSVSTVKPNVFPEDGVQLPTKESSSVQLQLQPATNVIMTVREAPEKPEEPKLPHRVQYHSGMVLDKDTIYVGRGSPWGNRFWLSEPKDDKARDTVIRLHRALLLSQLKRNPHFLDRLKGKNLACWCPLDKKCHADTLLELAN